MDKQKTVAIAQKVRAFVAGFVGVLIFAMGTTFFQERLVYRIPRILSPVFDLLGNVGAAIGMLIIGAGFIWWGFSRWKETGGKTSVYAIFAVVGLAAAIPLMHLDSKPTGSSAEIDEERERGRQEQIDAVRNTERPDLGPEAGTYFDKFTEIYERCKTNIANGDTDAVSASEDEFSEWYVATADILSKLDDDEKYAFGLYHAKLAIDWSDLRESKKQCGGASL